LFSHSFEQNKKNERPYLPRKQAWPSTMVFLNIIELFPDNYHFMIRA
jgi:hypothetical protein